MLASHAEESIRPKGYRGPDRRTSARPVVVEESLLKYLGKMGMGGIALYLVWQLSGDIKTSVTTTAATVTAMSESLKTHIVETTAQNKDRDRTLAMLLNVAVQQCVNATVVPVKRDACFAAVNTALPIR